LPLLISLHLCVGSIKKITKEVKKTGMKKNTIIIAILASGLLAVSVFMFTDEQDNSVPGSLENRNLRQSAVNEKVSPQSETFPADSKTSGNQRTNKKQTKVYSSESDSGSQEDKKKADRAIYRQRLQIVGSLENNLDLSERQELYDFLRNDENDASTLHVKDEIMRKLESQNKKPPEYIDELIDIAMDKNIDGDLRGYAVQHIRTAYPDPEDIQDSDETELREIEEALYQCLEDRDSDVSGTAILALSNLSQDHPDNFDTHIIDDAALSLAQDESVHIPSRITALRVCGQLGLEESADLARELAAEANDNVLRLVAIATLGDVGTSDDIELLESFLDSDFYRKAANLALKKIEER
jgi:hypothetical protein